MRTVGSKQLTVNRNKENRERTVINVVFANEVKQSPAFPSEDSIGMNVELREWSSDGEQLTVNRKRRTGN